MPRPLRTGVRRLSLVAFAVALVAATVGTAGIAVAAPGKGRATAAAQADCGRFATLRDAFDALGERRTRSEVFASIDRAARAFARTAADAPPAIADEMELLATSFADLNDELDRLRGKLRKTNVARKYDEMVDPIREAFAAWADRQDEEALAAAQTRVQEWLTAECGFVLGSGASGDDTTTAACTTADEARETVFDAWRAGDQEAASRCATDDAVAALFELPSSVDMTFAGCEGVDSNTADCSYRYEGGSLTMTVSRVDEERWQVSGITGRAD